MDDLTFKQLKESKYYHPVITKVMFDYDIMLEITIDGLNSTEIGYNTFGMLKCANGLPNIL